MKGLHVVLLLLLVSLSTGCSMNRPVAKDYQQYIKNNEDETVFPKTKMESNYFIDKATVSHRYEFRSIVTGYGNLWIVEFGKILDDTLKSKYVQSSFNRLSKISSKDKSKDKGNLIIFKLNNYEFKSHRAYISINISTLKNGHIMFSKNYTSQGNSQAGKMFWGGGIAMKNAVQQSTKFALDEIIENFIIDTNNNLASINH